MEEKTRQTAAVGGVASSGNGGSGGHSTNKLTVNQTAPTAAEIKTDYIVDVCRKNMTLTVIQFVFIVLTFCICLATLLFCVYKINQISDELTVTRSELHIVNKRHFMLAQDWCERMNPKK